MHHHRFREFFKDRLLEKAKAQGRLGAFVPCPLQSVMGPEQLTIVQDVYRIAAEAVGAISDNSCRHRHDEFSRN